MIDVPTTVPCALMADGTVVSPSEWNITTSGDAYIASASASRFPANVEWSARTTDLAATQTGSVEVAGTGDTASVSGPSDPADAALATTARFEWSFSKLDAGKNSDIIGKAAGGTAVLGSVTFTFSKVQTTFAVYSADDNSLTFYKRANVPVAGQMFEGKTATEVYEGVEKASYTAADGAPWAGHAAELASVTVADTGVAPVSTAYWFNGASKLRSVDIAALDTSKTTCMDGMFQGCSSLEALDLSAMSTRRVASMTAFLGGCDSLAELSLGSEFAWVGDDCYPPTGNWKQGSTGTNYAESQIPANKTDKYTRTKTAFAVYSADDQSLTFYKKFEAPVAGGVFEGKTATAVYTGFEAKMYGSAGNVPWADHAADIASVTVADEGIAPRATAMWFSNMTMLRSADVSKLNTSNVTSMHSMFNDCKALTSLDLSSFDTTKVTIMYSMFRDCNALTSLDVSSFDTRSVTNMCDMFNGCGSLTSLDLLSFNTNKVTDMYSMFRDCNALTSLDLSSFDTRSVTDMGDMFSDCNALTSLDLSAFDTANVTDMGGMFYGCKALTELSLSSFNTDKVKYMRTMFYGCNALTSLDLSSFDTRSVTDMGDMFSDCNALTSLDLSAFDTANVTDMGGMFYGCKALTELSLSSFNTDKVKYMSNMFSNCGSLTSLDLSSFNTRNVTSMYAIFSSCKALQKVAFGAGWRWVGTDGYLPTPFSAYIAGADGKWYDTDGKGYAPKDIPSNKAMTYTAVAPKKAFAVYSADDDSLNLYKRAAVPAAGEQFEGKTATEIYEGVEKASYTAADGAPWAGHAAELASVTVADEGIAPVSTAYWFNGASKLSSVDVSALDTSKTTCMDGMFNGCSSFESLDLSAISTRRVASMTAFLGGCDSLAELSIGSEFAWVGDDCYPPAGDWKQGSTGTDYPESDIPANKTDKYTRAKTAFAVYSADDDSLTFCKRAGMPSAGDQFEGKAATEVFTGFESETYGSADRIPWNSYGIQTVVVTDDGIAPKSTASWFKGQHSLKSADVSKLDMSKCKDVSYMFWECNSLGSINMSTWDTSSFENVSFMLGFCRSLRELDVLGWDVSNVINMENVFAYCSSIRTLDISTWDNSKTVNMNQAFAGMSHLEKVKLGDKFNWIGDGPRLPYPDDEFIPAANGKWYDVDGNSYAPEDIPSNKAMTYTAVPPKKAFAVYSSDDQSLNFYKRSAVPAAGERFEGKAATAVYTGIETNEYYDTNPWDHYVDDIKTVTVVDQGIAPVSTAYWFAFCKNLTTANLTKLDTSNVSNMTNTFHFCSSLTELEGVSNWNTSKVASMSCMFDLCPLTSLDLSNWDTSNVEHLQCMFSTCTSLTSVGDISNWDTSKVVSMAEMFGGCSKLSVNCSNWNVSKVANHNNFNGDAPGVTLPLAWQASSDEGAEDSAIAPLCEEQGSGDALSIPNESGNVEAGSRAKTSTDVVNATRKNIEGKLTHEEKAPEESDVTTETEGAEKTAVKKSAE